MKKNFALLLSVALLLGGVLACGLGTSAPTSSPTESAPPAVAADTPTSPPPTDTPTPEPAAGVEVQRVTFAHDLDDEMRPVDPGSEFIPDETVYLSVLLTGRTEGGVVTARFYRHDELLAEADVDLADIDSGAIFTSGEDTYVGYWLTHDGALLIGQAYRADVFYNDESLGSYDFRVVPPSDAIPSEVQEVTLARGSDPDYNPIEPTNTFAPDEEVYLVGRGDFGLFTWLMVEWYVDGQLDEAGTHRITLDEDASDAGFFFSFMPEEGWPLGEHQVALTMNDQEVGRYDFMIEEAPPVSLVPFEDPNGVFELSYPESFDQIEEDTAQGYSYTFLASDGSGAINVFFDSFDSPFADDEWEAFVEAYTLAGMPGFGEDAVELDRQVGKPGVHALYLEAESEESGLHGLVWVEEVEGVLAVVVLASPIEKWPEQEEAIAAALDSFTWSPEAAYAVTFEEEPTPTPAPSPTPTPPAPPPTATPAPAANPYAPPAGKATLVIFNNSDLEINFTVANQENKLAPHTEKVLHLDPGHHTFSFNTFGFEGVTGEGDMAAGRIYGWLFDGASYTVTWVDITQ